MAEPTHGDPPDAPPSDFYVVIPTNLIDLGPYAVAVYAVLRDFADMRSHECWPSHRAIATKANLSERKVQSVLHELRRHGWLTWTQRKGGNGTLTSNVYRLYGSRAQHDVHQVVHEVHQGPSAQDAPGGARGAEELLPTELLPTEVLEMPQPKSKTRKRPATTVPDAFPITDVMRTWAAAKAPGVDVDDQTERFLDWSRANGKTNSDWVAAWRNWIRRAPQFQSRPQPKPVQGTLALANRLRSQEQQ